MAIWQPVGRPAGRLTGHPEKSQWRRSTRRLTARYFLKRKKLNFWLTDPVDRTQPRVRVSQSVDHKHKHARPLAKGPVDGAVDRYGLHWAPVNRVVDRSGLK